MQSRRNSQFPEPRLRRGKTRRKGPSDRPVGSGKRLVLYVEDSATNALLMEEWTPLEPGALDHKTYVRGVGTVLERTVKGGDELDELISVTR